MNERIFCATDGDGEPTLWLVTVGTQPKPIVSRYQLHHDMRDLWPLIVERVVGATGR